MILLDETDLDADRLVVASLSKVTVTFEQNLSRSINLVQNFLHRTYTLNFQDFQKIVENNL